MTAAKKEIKACMNCGSEKIRWASKSEEGVLAKKGMRFMGVEEEAASIAYKCENCGYVGNPVIFNSEKDRKKFADLKKKNGHR